MNTLRLVAVENDKIRDLVCADQTKFRLLCGRLALLVSFREEVGVDQGITGRTIARLVCKDLSGRVLGVEILLGPLAFWPHTGIVTSFASKPDSSDYSMLIGALRGGAYEIMIASGPVAKGHLDRTAVSYRISLRTERIEVFAQIASDDFRADRGFLKISYVLNLLDIIDGRLECLSSVPVESLPSHRTLAQLPNSPVLLQSQ
jgi:hypothetical protein